MNSALILLTLTILFTENIPEAQNDIQMYAKIKYNNHGIQTFLNESKFQISTSCNKQIIACFIFNK